MLVVLLTLCFWQREGGPNDGLSVWFGMAVESALFGLALFGLSQCMGPLLEQLAQSWHQVEEQSGWIIFCQQRSFPGQNLSPPDPAIARILGFVGACIYEETLFRLLGYCGFVYIFFLADFPAFLSLVLAMLASSLLFAAAHHLGPQGEVFHTKVFIFRSVAGLFFAAIFQCRGFGVALGAHTCYDVLIGLMTRMR